MLSVGVELPPQRLHRHSHLGSPSSRFYGSVTFYTLASLYSMRTVRRGRCPRKGLELASEAPPRLRSASSSRGYNWVRLAAPLLAEAGASPGAST
ncbi:hypothetical protein ACLKA6_009281 [Drosophila palustris]